MKYLFANWKMYLSAQESVALSKSICELLALPKGYEMCVFPNTLSFTNVRDIFQDTTIRVGAQNVSWVPKGAFTGVTSASLFKDAGAAYAIIGHSEQRYIFGEGDTVVRKKLDACFDVGLTPVLCIGETQDDRNEDKRRYRIHKQLLTAFEGIDLSVHPCIVAYEPVWAIGTGNPCLPADAEDVVGWIKIQLKEFGGDMTPVIYGGSVVSNNVRSYLSLESVDGVLVGSVSTKFETLSALINMIE